MAFTKLYW